MRLQSAGGGDEDVMNAFEFTDSWLALCMRHPECDCAGMFVKRLLKKYTLNSTRATGMIIDLRSAGATMIDMSLYLDHPVDEEVT
jgi:hypothetical protein